MAASFEPKKGESVMSRSSNLTKTESSAALAQPQELAAGARPRMAPPCDVYESDDEILVLADIPGATSDALDIKLDDGVLTLRAQRTLDATTGKRIGSEILDYDYQRRFALPAGIDANRIAAKLKDGVLSLHLPKSDALRPRQIEVRSG
jgi:HSP20 family molecular chaperone IbpA